MPRNYKFHFTPEFYEPISTMDSSIDDEMLGQSKPLNNLIKSIIRDLIVIIADETLEKLSKQSPGFKLMEIDKDDLVIYLFNQVAENYGLPLTLIVNVPRIDNDPHIENLPPIDNGPHIDNLPRIDNDLRMQADLLFPNPIPFKDIVERALSPVRFNKKLLERISTLYEALYQKIKETCFPTMSSLSLDIFNSQREEITQYLEEWNTNYELLCQLDLPCFIHIDEITQTASLLPFEEAVLQLTPLLADASREIYLTEAISPCYTLTVNEEIHLYSDNGLDWQTSKGKVVTLDSFDLSQVKGTTLEDQYFLYAMQISFNKGLADLSHVIFPAQGDLQGFLLYCIKNEINGVIDYYIAAGQITSTLLAAPLPGKSTSLFMLLVSLSETELIHQLLDKNLITSQMLSEQMSGKQEHIPMMLLRKRETKLLQRLIEENLITAAHLLPPPPFDRKTFLECLIEKNQTSLIHLLSTKNLLSPLQLPHRQQLDQNCIRHLIKTEQAEILRIFLDQNLIRRGHVNWDGFLFESIQCMPTPLILLFIEQDLVTINHVDYVPDSTVSAREFPVNIPYLLALKQADEVFEALLLKQLITEAQIEVEFFSFPSPLLNRTIFHEESKPQPITSSTLTLLEQHQKTNLLQLINQQIPPSSEVRRPSQSSAAPELRGSRLRELVPLLRKSP
jgi:hypothetical protein